jgi:hypothetical protein
MERNCDKLAAGKVGLPPLLALTFSALTALERCKLFAGVIEAVF